MGGLHVVVFMFYIEISVTNVAYFFSKTCRLIELRLALRGTISVAPASPVILRLLIEVISLQTWTGREGSQASC